MRIGIIVGGIVAVAAAALPSTGSAAVRIEERSEMRFAGAIGKVARFVTGSEPEVETTITAATASRKVSISRKTGEIVDLDEGAMYQLDLENRTYTVSTFEELRRHAERARREAAATQRAGEKPSARAGAETDPGRASDGPANGPLHDLEIGVDLQETGRQRTINGFATREVVMRVTAYEKGKTIEESGGLAVTSSMWLTPRFPALKELNAFDQRFARKLAGALFAGFAVSEESSSAAGSAHPMLGDVLVRMRSEGAKMEGYPILTTTNVELVPTAAQLAEYEQAKREAQRSREAKRERSRPSLGKGVGGLLGGMVTEAVEKKVEKKVEERVGSSDDEGPNATLLTMTSEVVSVSTDVTAADLAMPAGFRRLR